MRYRVKTTVVLSMANKQMQKDKRAENLIPQAHVLTPDESSIGGKVSAQNRRNRKRAREVAEIMLSLPMHAGQMTNIEDINNLLESDADLNTDVLTGIIATLCKKALAGNYRATELLLTLSGDYSKRMEVSADVHDESSALLGDYLNDPSHWNIGTHNADTMVARMYEWFIYRDDLNQIALRFSKNELEEIRISFTNATDLAKIEFAHMVCGDNKIPDDESLFLYESKYKPDVMEHLFPEEHVPVIPQTIDEYMEMKQKGKD